MGASVVLAGMTGCSDLLGSTSADAVVKIEADNRAEVLLTRQEVLRSAATWGGTRVGEQTTDASETALEFTLPGENLDVALAAIGNLEARVVSTTIDVDAEQIDRTPTTTVAGTAPADPADPTPEQVRLRVEVSAVAPAGAGALLRLLMAVFSVIGVVATSRWTAGWWRRRGGRNEPPHRNIDRVDLHGDPPTQETPRVPPQW